MQKNEKSSQKWVFLSWPNMALTKSGFKTNLVSFWRQNRRRRGEEEKREEEERKEEEEEEEQAKPSSKKVWNQP